MPEISDEQLDAAFRLWAARRVANADEELTRGEIDLVARHLPDQMLVRLGFLDPDAMALTPLYHVAKGRALTELPKRMNDAQKANLLAFLRAVALDGGEQPEESQVIAEIVALLGL